MFKLLQPKLAVDSIYHINLKELQKMGIKHLLIDLDNTITEWNNHHLPQKALDWFASLEKYDLKSCLVSNNTESRVNIAAKQLGIPSVPKAQKPRTRAFKRGMKLLDAKPNNTAMIGDQVFTDILGGNRMGIYTILVMPINTKEFVGTKVARMLERIILKRGN